MPDGDDKKAARADVDALLRKQDWTRIYKELVKYGLAITKGNEADAQDLAQKAIERVLDPNWEPWDPAKHPEVKDFLVRIMNRLLRNDRTSARAHREIVMDREAKERSRARAVAYEAENVGTGESSAEDRLAAARLVVPRMKRLREVIGDDAAVHAVVDQEELGKDKPRDQATATGYTIEQIYDARRRLGRHIERVKREIPEE